MKFLRVKGVAAIQGVSRASVYNLERDGLLPGRVKLGPHTTVWPEGEVIEVMRARVAGCSDEEIRALVTDLHGRRQKAKPMIRAATRDVARKEDSRE